MKNSQKNNTLKRVAAGALSVLTVAAYSMPANVGGFLTGGNNIVAFAAEFLNFEELNVDDALVPCISEADETWTVVALPNTVIVNNKANETELTFNDVVSIDEDGVKYKDPDSEIEDSLLVANFIDEGKRDHFEIGDFGIFVDAIDLENKTLTISSICNKETTGLSLDFNHDNVRNSIKEVYNGDEGNYNMSNFSGVLDNIKTGDVLRITSKKALDFKNDVENDVRFSYIYEADDEAAEKYTYLITVGRNDIDAFIRETGYQYVLAEEDGDTIPEFSVVDENEVEVEGALYPDDQYAVISGENNLTIYEDTNDNGELDDEDIQVPYVKATADELLEEHSYSFTAPYNNIFVTRSKPHSHYWEWSVEDSKLIATCNKNGEENSHKESVSHKYGFKLFVSGETKPFVPYGSEYEFIFDAIGDGDEYTEAQKVLTSKFGETVIRYIVKDEDGNDVLTDEKPENIGNYKVVADLYIPDEFGGYSIDDEGEKRIIMDYSILPAEEGLTLTLANPYDYQTYFDEINEKTYPEAYYKDNNDNAWVAPVVTVKNGNTILTEGEDYILEGDVTATTKGEKTIVAVGIGNYEGYIGTFDWYAPDDLNYSLYSFTGGYGQLLEIGVDGFEGDQSQITYKAISVFDEENYKAWKQCETEEDKENFISQYEGIMGEGSFVEPTEPESKTLGKINDLEIRLPEGVNIIDAYTPYGEEIYEGYVNPYYAKMNEYTIYAIVGDKVIASNTFTNRPAQVYVDLKKDFVTYDGLDHVNDFKLSVEDEYYWELEWVLSHPDYYFDENQQYYEAYKESFNEMMENIKSLDSQLESIKLSCAEGKIINAGDYSLTVDYNELSEVFGSNYLFNFDTSYYDDDDNLIMVEYAYVEPVSIDGFIASADETVFVETDKYQKPDIVVKAADGTILEANKDYRLAGTVSAKSGGNYTTRIIGIGNYTGVLKVDWTILDQADFEAAINVDWNEDLPATPMILSDGRKAIKAAFTREATEDSEGYEVVNCGFIYSNVKNCDEQLDGLIIENVDGTNIKKNVAKSTAFNGTYILSLVDKGFGVAARGYVTLKNTTTGAECTVYTTPTYLDYEELLEAQMQAAIDLSYIIPPTALVESGKDLIQVKFRREMVEDADEGLIVSEYGYVYSNVAAPDPEDYVVADEFEDGTENPEYIEELDKWNDMSLDGVDGTVIKKNFKTNTSASNNDGIYSVKFVDKGYGVRYRAYVILKNADGATFIKYADADEEEYLTANFNELKEEQANNLVTVNNELIDANVVGNGYTAAKFRTSRDLAEGVLANDVTVLEFGFIYTNGLAEEPQNFIVGAEGVKKNGKSGDSLAATGAYNLTIKRVDDNPIFTRGFVKVKDNKTGLECYVYSDVISDQQIEPV